MTRAIVETLKRNVRKALSDGQLLEAEQILTRLKKEEPLSRDTRGFELELYLKTDRLIEADTLARQLCNLFPDSGRIHFLAGKLAYKQKRYAEAASRFRESGRIFPQWQTQYWLGKTLTQTGHFDEAESLLLAAIDQSRQVLLDLAWLYERKNDLEAAHHAYQQYLQHDPADSFASNQIIRIKAKMLEPETFIEEVDTLAQMGEHISDALLPEFVQRLFETARAPRARQEILARLDKMDARVATRLAWICYKAHAYDLACSLFLQHLQVNLSNYKYLNALESAAIKSARIPQLLEGYRQLVSQNPQLHGRSRKLARHIRE